MPMTMENESTITTLVHLLNRADAREQEIHAALTEANRQVEELQAQKATDADYIQRLAGQNTTLLSTDREDVNDLNERLLESERQLKIMRANWADANDRASVAQFGVNLTLLRLAFKSDGKSAGWGLFISEKHEEDYMHFLAAIHDPRGKINAIRYARAITGCELKDGKNFVESLLAEHNYEAN